MTARAAKSAQLFAVADPILRRIAARPGGTVDAGKPHNELAPKASGRDDRHSTTPIIRMQWSGFVLAEAQRSSRRSCEGDKVVGALSGPTLLKRQVIHSVAYWFTAGAASQAMHRRATGGHAQRGRSLRFAERHRVLSGRHAVNISFACSLSSASREVEARKLNDLARPSAKKRKEILSGNATRRGGSRKTRPQRTVLASMLHQLRDQRVSIRVYLRRPNDTTRSLIPFLPDAVNDTHGTHRRGDRITGERAPN